MSRIYSLFIRIVGEKNNRDPERYFVTIVCFFASIFLLGLCMVHILMNLKLAPVFFAGGSSLVMMGLYFLVRFNTCLFYPKLVLTVWGLVMLDLTWYAKFLSNGPVLFFILIFGALIIWVWEGRQLAVMVGMYFLNIIVLFIIDSLAPDHLFAYPDLRSRTVDIYLSLFLYTSLLIFLLFIVKKEFTRQRDLAVQSDKLKSAFLANMSHEIRTPMNAIVGFSQLLDQQDSPESCKQYTDIIRNSSKSLLMMINDLLDLSKIEAGDLEIKFSDANIEDVFRELKEMFLIELSDRGRSGVKLDYTLPDGNFVVCSDILRLKQVLSNLLSNAVKFTLEGQIIFSCSIIKSDVLFSVSDTGIGIELEHRSKIFNQFSSFNTNEMNGEGSGLGLAIVDKIVDLLNGQVWFESSPGTGSTFYFTIPRRSLTGKPDKIASRGKTDLPANGAITKPILVVEDNELNKIVLAEMLRKLEYKFHLVSTGEEAIDYVRSNPGTALVLLDLNLPGIDGYQAARTIREINPGIKIIAQTAFAIPDDADKIIEAGCDDYLLKPIALEKLTQILETSLKN